MSPENLAIVRQGMRQAVTNGTAYLLNVPGVDVAGKTGTAEYTAWTKRATLSSMTWGAFRHTPGSPLLRRMTTHRWPW